MRLHQFVRPAGPLGPFAEEYRQHLVGLGYSFGSIQHRLSQFADISRWLEAEQLTAAGFDQSTARGFVAARASRGRVSWVSPLTVRLPLEFLRGIGVAGVEVEGNGPFSELLSGYGRYLSEERGLATKTVAAHLVAASRFCSNVAADADGLAGLSCAEVTTYLVRACAEQSRGEAQKTAGALRSLLGYLHLNAVTPLSLVFSVPKVAGARPGPQPIALTTTEVSRLLSCCDRRRGVGRRDYAIVLLMARLGLRAGEVAAMTLDDVDWQHGELLVRGKGNRHEHLPLPQDVGTAIVGYLQRGRPRTETACRVRFLRSRAPWTPLTLSAVQTVVRDAARRAGFCPFIGPRRLRHHAATQMHQGGGSLAVVAEVLRHHDTRVTRIYIDVPATALADLARVWPGGAS